MAESAASCACCGKKGVEMKRCARCMDAWYCGTDCQKEHWKQHKKTCAKPLPVVFEQMAAAFDASDWRAVIKLEGRMEEMMEERMNDLTGERILRVFLVSYTNLSMSDYSQADVAIKVIGLQERRMKFLIKMKHFRDLGEAMHNVALHLMALGRKSEAGSYLKQARALGEEHGFYSVECRSCQGLGQFALKEGRIEEGLEFMRLALAAANFCEVEEEGKTYELHLLQELIDALLVDCNCPPSTSAIDEAEPLVIHFREVFP